jgi:large subunit ribosomal protein L15
MKYHQLEGKSKSSKKRVGRGISAGQGKTAGRGTKGQKARTGWSLRPGFAGGQNPLMQQLPKLPGFKSHRVKPTNVYTDQINEIKDTNITAETLTKTGLIANAHLNVKLLYRGDIKGKLNVKLTGASQKAVEAIEKSGGSFTKVERIPRQPKKDSK